MFYVGGSMDYPEFKIYFDEVSDKWVCEQKWDDGEINQAEGDSAISALFNIANSKYYR